jgi:hypothetical protein
LSGRGRLARGGPDEAGPSPWGRGRLARVSSHRISRDGAAWHDCPRGRSRMA